MDDKTIIQLMKDNPGMTFKQNGPPIGFWLLGCVIAICFTIGAIFTNKEHTHTEEQSDGTNTPTELRTEDNR